MDGSQNRMMLLTLIRVWNHWFWEGWLRISCFQDSDYIYMDTPILQIMFISLWSSTKIGDSVLYYALRRLLPYLPCDPALKSFLNEFFTFMKSARYDQRPNIGNEVSCCKYQGNVSSALHSNTMYRDSWVLYWIASCHLSPALTMGLHARSGGRIYYAPC